MSMFNSYSNPEYMCLDELTFLIEDYKREKFALERKPAQKFSTLPYQKPPKKRPPSPPRTPPPILNRKSFHSVPLYQNVPSSISQYFSDSSSSNATMIVKESSTPPKPLMTSSRLQLNPAQKQPSKSFFQNFRDIHEEFLLDEEQDDATRVYESTRIKARSPNGTYNITQEDISIFCSNPNYYYLQYSSNYEPEFKSPDLFEKLENLKNISPPSPFKEGSKKKFNTYLAQLSPSVNFSTKEPLLDNLCCCSDVCLSCSHPETCSSTSTSGYKSNQSNLSNYSQNSTNLVELNQFIEMNMQRLDRLKNKRKQLIKNSSSSHSINSNGI